ncbi:MAG: ABC transporter permease [bacterium]
MSDYNNHLDNNDNGNGKNSFQERFNATRFLKIQDWNLMRLFLITVGIFIVMSLLMPTKFPRVLNFQSMGFQMSEIGILGIAMALAMITGGIDLSLNSVANLTGILCSVILTRLAGPNVAEPQVGLAVFLAIVIGLVIGIVCGLLNGFLIAYVGIPAMLATLGSMTLFTGFAFVITKGTGFFGIEAFQKIGNGYVAGIPIPLIIFAAVAVIMIVVMNNSSFGLKLYLLGSNPKASIFSGIDNRKVLLRTYALSGMLAALAGIVILGRTNSANPDYGASYVLQALLIAVLGGVNVNGGFGKILGLVLAVFSLQFLSTGLNMLLFRSPGANFFKMFSWGALIILFMIINVVSERRKQRGSIKKPKPA